MTLDNAINDFATELFTSLPDGSRIAVISFETNKNSLMNHFIDSMVDKLAGKNGKDVRVYERKDIENILKELNFSLTGYVSDETAQLIGHFVGADTLIYGSMRISNDDYRLAMRAAVTETAEILLANSYDLRLDSRLRGLLGIAKKEPGKETYYWTAGASIGTSFAEPWVIGTIHGTFAPFPYSFLEIGLDLGFVSGVPDVVKYYSVYPFVHYALFIPFGKGGGYIGAGAGYMFGERTYQDLKDSISIIAADFIVGLNILGGFDISYTLRTNFTSVSNKFSLGYTYRFN
jgi:TolB-like protein